MPIDELSSALRALEGNDSPRFDQIAEFLQLVSQLITLVSLWYTPDHIKNDVPLTDEGTQLNFAGKRSESPGSRTDIQVRHLTFKKIR
jgi:hypothetical protein